MKKCFSGFLIAVFLLSFSTTILAKEHAPKISLTKLPLSFIKNDGQRDSSIFYYEQGSGHVTAFTKEGISFVLSKMLKDKDTKQISEVVTLTPLNTSPFTIEAIDKREGKINYLIGNDSKKWKTNIPTYGAILYKGIYPGIDMKFYGTNSQLEYDIIVSPHADPSKINLSYKGIEKLSITSTGDLNISLKEGSLLQKEPHVYQTINGTKKEIEGKFILAGTTYSFEVGPYDKNHPLVIDPVLVYSTYLGGSDSERAFSIAVDSSGNAYVAGLTTSTDFPTQNPFQELKGQYWDGFVAKFNSSGTELIYATYLGGSWDDQPRAIAVDSSGNAYVTGFTRSDDFPTQNPYQGTYTGGTDGFITKLNSAGNALVYSTYLGGSDEDQVLSIAVDFSDNAYVAGYTRSLDFPTKNPGQATNAGGASDAFVTKFNASGTLIYSTYLGGSGLDVAKGIAVDSSGNAYVAGSTESEDFPTQNPYQESLAGGSGSRDAFVTKFYPLGNALVYSTYLGGSGLDSAQGIAVDSFGNAYVTGQTNSVADFPTKNPYQATKAGASDAFVTKFNSTGNALIYSTYIGGSGDDIPWGIAVDSSGNANIAGETASTDFPMQDSHQTTYGGGIYDAFITKFNSSGSNLVYSTYLGGGNTDSAGAIAIDSSGNAYVAGYTESTDFPTKNPYQETNTGGDAFIIKLSFDSSLSRTLTVHRIGVGSGTVISNPYGINCGLDCTEMYLKGDIITLTATAEADSIFGGWSGGGCLGTGTCVINMTVDVSVNARFFIRPQLSTDEGTIGTQLAIISSDFGTKKGKVLIGGVASKIAKEGWQTDSITCTVTKVPPVGTHEVTIKPDKADDIILPDAFTVKPPEIDSLNSYIGTGGITPITITGNFFSTKKGKVYLEYEKDGQPKKKNCKVTSWSMDSITFIVPKTSKSFPAGTYPLKVMNKVGTAEAPSEFTID